MSHAGNWMGTCSSRSWRHPVRALPRSVGYAMRRRAVRRPAPAAPLRRQVADAPDHTTAKLLPTLGGVEPVTTTLRRLIGSSVVVGPASVSRRHEGPSWMVVSRRSGKSRPPRWAARLQARVGSGSASPPRSSRRTWPAHCLFCQVGLARLVSAGRRADAASLGRRREGPLGPTWAGPSAAAAPCWEARPQAKTRCVRGLVLWWRFTTYRLGRFCTALADAPDHTTAKPLPALGSVEPPYLCWDPRSMGCSGDGLMGCGPAVVDGRVLLGWRRGEGGAPAAQRGRTTLAPATDRQMLAGEEQAGSALAGHLLAGDGWWSVRCRARAPSLILVHGLLARRRDA
jgi:hypothetical protein